MNINNIDEKARIAAKAYKKLEQELLGLIIKIDENKLFYQLGFNSLFQYLTDALELSPAVASTFINVARKSQQVPELKEHVETGKLSIYKAQRITSVITSENSKIWLDLAQKKTHRELEREVAITSPKQAIREKTKYISVLEDGPKEKVRVKKEIPRLELQMGISEKLMLKIRRAQDLESQRNKKNLNLEETLEEVLFVYLDKRDPLKKAQRQKARGNLSDTKLKGQQTSSATPKVKKCRTIDKNHARAKRDEREPIPAKLKHRLQLRDNSQCTYVDSTGKRCSSQRYLEAHHIKPVSLGGENSLDNLRLLCSGHHKFLHHQMG